MTETLSAYLADSSNNLKTAANGGLDGVMEEAIARIVTALKADKPLLICGNGGSMADSLHIAGELAAKFLLNRRGLKVIALGANPATASAWSNDVNFTSLFAREVEGLGEREGVLLGISTSGNSQNVIEAFSQAKAMGMIRVALTGRGGGEMASLADILIAAPVEGVPRIQEVHSSLYHYLCMRVEAALA